MILTDEELDALQDAVNFIAHNSDAADNAEPYIKMANTIRNIWNRGCTESARKKKKKVFKSNLEKILEEIDKRNKKTTP